MQQITVGLNIFVTLEVEDSKIPKQVVNEVQHRVAAGLSTVQLNEKNWVEVQTLLDENATTIVEF